MKKYFLSFCLLAMLLNSFSQVSFVLSNTICVGSTATLTANNGTFAAIGYSWTSSPPGAVIASPNNSTTAITFTDGANYTVVLTVDDGTTLATDSKTINAGPQIVITPSYAINCPPPTPIGPTILVASGAASYTWMPGSLIGGTVSIPNPAVSTTFTVFVKDANGCLGSAEQYWPKYPLPSLFAGSSSPVCAGNLLCMNASGSLNIYYWQGPCGYTSFNPNDCFLAPLGCGGTYTIGGTDSNGCENEAYVGVVISPCTGIEELSHDNSFSIYPNPGSEKISIKLNSEINNPSIEITDALGRIVSNQPEAIVASDLIDINISKLNKGLYFVKLTSGSTTIKIEKLIKD